MSNLAQLQKRIDTVAQANNRAALSQEQFQLLVQGASPSVIDWLSQLVESAAEGNTDALEMFKKVHTATRITESFRTHGFPETSKNTVLALLDLHGTTRVINATRALMEGDTRARSEIRTWLQTSAKPSQAPRDDHAPAGGGGSRGQASDEPDDRSGRPPANAPASAAHEPGGARRFGQCPPPPGVRTSQVRPAPGADAGNVHRLHQPAQSSRPSPASTRDDDRTISRAPSQPSHDAPADDYRPANAGQQAGTARQYDQHACFGKDIAVQFQNLPTRDRTHNTVMIKIARAKGTTCKQGVDWDRAILINLEPNEVETCAAVLLGLGHKVRYAGHGPTNDKWFELSETTENWAGSIRLQVGQGDDRRSVNIGPTDVGQVAALFLRALATQVRVAPALYPLILRRSYDLYQKNVDSTEARRSQPRRQA